MAEAEPQMAVEDQEILLQLVPLKEIMDHQEDHVMVMEVAEELLTHLKQLTTNQDQVLQEDSVEMERLQELIQAHVSEQMDQLQEDGLLEEDKVHLLIHQLREADVVAEDGGNL